MENKLEEITKDLITEIGEDPNREGLLKTPKRVAKHGNFSQEGITKKLMML